MEKAYEIAKEFLEKNSDHLTPDQVRFIKVKVSEIVKSKFLSQDDKKELVFSILRRNFPNLLYEHDRLEDLPTNKVKEVDSSIKNESFNKNIVPGNFQNESNIYDTSFSFHRYIKNLNVRDFIEKNQIFDESKSRVIPKHTLCFFCNSKIVSGECVRLTDGTFLCEQCFIKLQSIKYPEKYQKSFEDYLLKNEAYKIGKKEFLESLPYFEKIKKLNSISQTLTKGFSAIFFLFVISIFFMSEYFIERIFVLIMIFSIIGIINKIISQKERELRKEIENKINHWNRLNPEPQKPVLKSFYDPQAILTNFDKKVLHVFNHWPGYPPFWDYLRDRILERDNQRCQVTGCPSRTELHLHHKRPISSGGSHTPENLVTLCAFHHGIQPDPGHERIWGNIKTQYFTLVSKHTRHNRKSYGIHTVRAHLRRLELITLDDLKQLNAIYQYSCPFCENLKLEFSLNKNEIYVLCKSCGKGWKGQRELAEETGPRLSEILKVSRNQGTCTTPWEILSKRTSSIWGEWKTKKVKNKRKTVKVDKSTFGRRPTCPVCGSLMKLIQPKPGDKWKPFWGCSKYNVTGCKGSTPFDS